MTINGYYFVDIKSLTAIQQLTMTAHYHHFILAPIKNEYTFISAREIHK